MTTAIVDRLAPYLRFEKFRPDDFMQVLTPQERKIVLRDIEISSLLKMQTYFEQLCRSHDTTVNNHALYAGDHLHYLISYLAPSPGLDRLFHNPRKTAMRDMQMEGMTIPSMDEVLANLSTRLHLLARDAKKNNWDIEEMFNNPRPEVQPEYRSAYAKAFGPRPLTP